MVDFTTAVGKRAATLLATEQIIWFTTVGSDHAPQPSPVWFLWDGDALTIFSRPDVPKVRNVAENPRVALNFRTDSLVISGEAVIVPDAPRADALAPYVEKYHEGIMRLGMTPESFAATYSTTIRVKPTRLRGN